MDYVVGLLVGMAVTWILMRRNESGAPRAPATRVPVPDWTELEQHEMQLARWVGLHLTHSPTGIARLLDMHMEHHGRARETTVCGCVFCTPDTAQDEGEGIAA